MTVIMKWMKKKQKKTNKDDARKTGLFVGKIFKQLAPSIGARVVTEPEWGIASQIVFKNGRKRYLRYSSIDLNPLGASEIAKDKDYSNFFMKKMGYPTIPGKTFFASHWAQAIGSKRDVHAAYRYAKKLGFPVVVKPNSGSQGVGVAKVYNKQEFSRAMKYVFTWDRVALVQRPVHGKDYRIVVLDNEIISAYERLPLSVTGDGRRNIRQLLIKKQKEFVAARRDTRIKMNDPRIKERLKHEGRTLRSVPAKGETVALLDNANLSSGGDARDVTGTIHPGFKKIAVRLTRDMGLRICGVDLMVAGDITKPPGRYWVLEVNAAPGLDHYVSTGEKQERAVRAMYLKVLKAMQ